MVLDDGLPLVYTQDLVALAGAYIDLAKIKTGTVRLYPRKALLAKLRLYQRNRIQPFLGGQFHEYVFATQGARALLSASRRSRSPTMLCRSPRPSAARRFEVQQPRD